MKHPVFHPHSEPWPLLGWVAYCLLLMALTAGVGAALTLGVHP